MRLTDLNPQFLSSGGEGVWNSLTGEPIAKTEGVGIDFDCPCGNRDEEHRCFVPFCNPVGPGPLLSRESGWRRQGSTFEELTLTPSIRRVGGCGWHGVITKGEVITV